MSQFDQLFDAICDKALECGLIDCGSLNSAPVPDELGLGGEENQSLAQIREGVANGEIVVFEDHLSACFEGIAAAECPPGYDDENVDAAEEFIENCGDDEINSVLGFN